VDAVVASHAPQSVPGAPTDVFLALDPSSISLRKAYRPSRTVCS
jgi:hypothetical protein